MGECMCTRAGRFLARFNRLKLCAPLVETSSGYAELLGQLIDAFAGTHALHSYALELPGISLLLSTAVSSPGESAHRECANSRGHSMK